MNSHSFAPSGTDKDHIGPQCGCESGCFQIYTVLKFVVGSFGLDSSHLILDTSYEIWEQLHRYL
jgi:hypothetical protein